MNPQEREEQKAIVIANAENADKAADKLFVCYYSENNLDSALVYARKVMEIGKERKDSKIWVEGYTQLAAAYLDLPNLDSSRHYLNLILTETASSKEPYMAKFRARAFMYFGALYQSNNLDTKETFAYFKKAIETSKKANYTHGYIRSNLAMMSNLMERKRYNEVGEMLTDVYQYLEEHEAENKNIPNFINKVKGVYLTKIATTEQERKEAMEMMLSTYKEADVLNLHRQKANIFIDLAIHFTESRDRPFKCVCGLGFL